MAEIGNQYHDNKGHFTNEKNDGGACHHFGIKEAEEYLKANPDQTYSLKVQRLMQQGGEYDTEFNVKENRNEKILFESNEDKRLIQVPNEEKPKLKTKLNLRTGEKTYVVLGDGIMTDSYKTPEEAINVWNKAAERRLLIAKEREETREKASKELKDSISKISDSQTRKEAEEILRLREEYLSSDGNEYDFQRSLEKIGYFPLNSNIFVKKGDLNLDFPFVVKSELSISSKDNSSWKNNIKNTLKTYYFNANEKYLSGKPRDTFDSESDLREYYSKTKGEIEEGKQKENAYKNASDEDKIKMAMQNDFDPSFYLSNDNITSGTRVGGYSGWSKSNSAVASEESGSMPKSKWTKQAINDFINDSEYADEMRPYMPLLNKLSLNELKDIVLYNDGWHHTSKMYNKTDFYGINSPANIVSSLMSKLRFEKGLKRGFEQ